MANKQTESAADQFCLPASFPNPSADSSMGFKLLCLAAPPPHGAPDLLHVASGAIKAMKSALNLIQEPNELAKKILAHFESMLQHCQETLRTNELANLQGGLDGTRTRHPEWTQFSTVSHTKQHPLADAFLGLKLLVAIDEEKKIPHAGLQRAKQLYKEETLTDSQLSAIIYGSTPDEFLGQSWTRDLMRTWRQAVAIYSHLPTPPPSPLERLSSQLVNSMIHGNTALSAGAQTDRQLSAGQTQLALEHIKNELATDSLRGVAGLLVCLTTFSVDVVCKIPLNITEGATDWLIHIDVLAGTICIEYEHLVPNAAIPTGGSIPSCFILKKALPKALVKNLQKRLQQYPSSKMLLDLYPGESPPGNDHQIFSGKHGISPTWPKLRKTCSRLLRELGLNILIVSIITGDFSIVPRSKWYYASISPQEIIDGLNKLYQLAGWGEAYTTDAALNFGSQVVPTEKSTKMIDSQLVNAVSATRPGRNATTFSLIKFHNAYCNLTGFRLSILFALREARELNLLADIDESQDAWFPFHDKIVPNDGGWMPMPLCKFAKELIIAWRIHCKAMRRRFEHLGLQGSDFARWCAAVESRKGVALLACIDEVGNMRPLASQDFSFKDDSSCLLPADLGRKIQENFLRHSGLKSTEIDAILRHLQRGQRHSTNTSDFNFQTLWSRFESAMKTYCDCIFGDVVNGLAKE